MLLEFAASLLQSRDALAAPKLACLEIARAPRHKQMTGKDLVEDWRLKSRHRLNIRENQKCNTMHIRCTLLPKSPVNTKPMAGSGPAMGAGESLFLKA